MLSVDIGESYTWESSREKPDELPQSAMVVMKRRFRALHDLTAQDEAFDEVWDGRCLCSG